MYIYFASHYYTELIQFLFILDRAVLIIWTNIICINYDLIKYFFAYNFYLLRLHHEFLLTCQFRCYCCHDLFLSTQRLKIDRIKSVRAYVRLYDSFAFYRASGSIEIYRFLPHYSGGRKLIVTTYLIEKAASRTVVSTPAFLRLLPSSWSPRRQDRDRFFHRYAIQLRGKRYVLAKTRPLVTNICMSRNRHTNTTADSNRRPTLARL